MGKIATTLRWWLPPLTAFVAALVFVGTLGASLGQRTNDWGYQNLVSSDDEQVDWIGLRLPREARTPEAWWCFDPAQMKEPSEFMARAASEGQQLCLVTQATLVETDEEALSSEDVAAVVRRELAQIEQPATEVTQEVTVNNLPAEKDGIQWAQWAAVVVASLAFAVTAYDRRSRLPAWVRRLFEGSSGSRPAPKRRRR